VRKAIVLAAAVALVCASTALAGGWATVKLSSQPTGLAAGEPWIVDITVLQHGLASQPLSGLKPTVTIRKITTTRTVGSGPAKPPATRRFSARPTSRVGVYRARVVFPAAGTWRFAVYDAFTEYGGARTHTFKPVRIVPSDT
jgi:hypothetical protein